MSNKVFPVENWKSEHHWWLRHIWISPGNKFQLKLAILIFGPNLSKKGCFQSKSEKMNTTIELCIFKFVYIPNYSLNRQFWFSGPNLSKKSISRQNWKKVNDMNSAYLKFLGTKLQLQDEIFLKRVFPIKNRKSEQHVRLNSAYSN